ncbi:class I SAM-dependent methyltransferase [Streptomyces sp. NPDC059063]|uniref:class I SAM-dependent methyltransferase n=1 Tax=Streptomyces sp. NPDC059063 TaxID=3346712 RepID=UPI0036CB26D1
MPYSDSEGKDAALAWYQEIEPGTVIDVGAGCGTYAQAVRAGSSWKGRWTAVEAWEPYVGRFGLAGLYDGVVIADARRLVAPFYRADLVIAGDVLEHMPRADAVQLLDKVRVHAANLIVSVPVLHLDQGAVYGNPYETHIDHWSADQMRAELSRSGTIRGEFVGDVLACFWWAR